MSPTGNSYVKTLYCPACVFNITAMGDAIVPEAFRRAMADVLFVDTNAIHVDSLESSGYIGGTCISSLCENPQMRITFTVTVPGMDMNAYLSATALLYAFYEAANSVSSTIRSSLIAALAARNFPNVYYINTMSDYSVLYQAQGVTTVAPTLSPTPTPTPAPTPTPTQAPGTPSGVLMSDDGPGYRLPVLGTMGDD